jgi:hypothetical protein
MRRLRAEAENDAATQRARHGTCTPSLRPRARPFIYAPAIYAREAPAPVLCLPQTVVHYCIRTQAQVVVIVRFVSPAQRYLRSWQIGSGPRLGDGISFARRLSLG